MGLLRPLHHLDTFIAGVVAIDRNQWSRSTGMPGRVRLESVVAIDRNTQMAQRIRLATGRASARGNWEKNTPERWGRSVSFSLDPGQPPAAGGRAPYHYVAARLGVVQAAAVSVGSDNA